MRGKSPAAAFIGLLILAVLAACGGGGGGGGTLPATGPSTSSGGSPGPTPTTGTTPGKTPTPSPSPSASPSTQPSGQPSATPTDPATPTPTPVPTPTPTPVPTPTPTPVPTPTPTPVPTPTPTPVPTPTPTPNPGITPFAFTWDGAGYGATPRPPNLDNQFVTSNNDHDTQNGSYDGDLMPTDPGAKPGGGGQGPVGNTVDGISCDATMHNDYHVHAYIGLFVNGNQLVIPDAIGIVHAQGDAFDPNADAPNQEIYGDCFYHMHTHDSSGMIHIETYNPLGLSNQASVFNINQFFDIWGVLVNGMQFGPFGGPVTVYTSGQFSRAATSCTPETNCEIGSNMYSLYTGDPTQIPLYSHEVIWYEVGTGNPDMRHLPGVAFGGKQ